MISQNLITIPEKKLTGLSHPSVILSRKRHGENIISTKQTHPVVELLIDIVKEPMVIILLVISAIYISTGNYSEAIMLGLAILAISFISAYQSQKSSKALEALKVLRQPLYKVIRDGNEIEIRTEEIVVGDLLIIEEGVSIPADGYIIQSNDLSIDQSTLTGESLPVLKGVDYVDNLAYHGTLVTSGRAIIEVNKIGDRTEFAQLSKSLETVDETKSPLDAEISSVVKKMVVLGVAIFLGTWLLNYLRGESVLQGLLFALTIAMSILPEEIPVAFTTFMALGSKRLIKEGVIVKNGKTLEALGNATVICADKTGTITQNKMSIAGCYNLRDRHTSIEADSFAEFQELIWLSRLASEPVAFDPMEQAIIELYEKEIEANNYSELEFIHEYPLGGKPPMMTHIYRDINGKNIVACKGAPEALIANSSLSDEEESAILNQLDFFTTKGYRVLGVGTAAHQSNEFPKDQRDFDFVMQGLVAFYDPPKEDISEVFDQLEAAGLETKIITGDNEKTTVSIAKQINFNDYDKKVDGAELMAMSDDNFVQTALGSKLFTRMFPAAKLKVVEQMQAQGEVIAMVGDGVNDGPALKAAHIGIAMGKKGTEVAKEVSDLIIADDDLAKLLPAIAMGRRIHTNLKKAIGYIISIHIPIVLIVFFPVALGWKYPQIFSPIHVIILELIMGPTCSIVYENEPMEVRNMDGKYWNHRKLLFDKSDLIMTIMQGLMITLGLIGIYQYAVISGLSETTTRTMVFSTLISANIFLTLVNRSSIDSTIKSMRNKNKLMPIILGIVILMMVVIMCLPLLRELFSFEIMDAYQILICIAVGVVSVGWYELVKWYRRARLNLQLREMKISPL